MCITMISRTYKDNWEFVTQIHVHNSLLWYAELAQLKVGQKVCMNTQKLVSIALWLIMTSVDYDLVFPNPTIRYAPIYVEPYRPWCGWLPMYIRCKGCQQNVFIQVQILDLEVFIILGFALMMFKGRRVKMQAIELNTRWIIINDNYY